MANLLIFTDLDGTLLHSRTYSADEAGPALDEIRKRKIPLVFVSSKTRAEIETYRKRLSNDHPFIVENGGGIFVPEGYFPFPTGGTRRGAYSVTVLGAPYAVLRKEIARLRESLKTDVKGFGDMSAEEIAAITGLSVSEAALAREREFDEPFLFAREPDERFLKAVLDRGLRWTRGRLYHVMGRSDKGMAVRMLKTWYARTHGTTVSIGLGDGLNDLPMLKEVDHAVLVKREDGSHDPDVHLAGIMRTSGIGPAGWNESVIGLLGALH